MFDSSVKSLVGIEYGNDYQFGNFDQCMNISTTLDVDQVNIQPKYCLLDVKVDGLTIRSAATRNREVNTFLISFKYNLT